MALYRKELADHFASPRFRLVFALISLASLASLAGALGAVSNSNSLSSEMLFLSIYTTSGSSIPSFASFMAYLSPLMGIVLGFDVISREKSQGTMSRLVSQPIHRDAVITAKFLAGAAAIALVILFDGVLVGAIGLVSIGVPPSLEEITRILCYLAMTWVYTAMWLGVAMLCSTVCTHVATSALITIGIRIYLTVFASILADVIANIAYPLEGMQGFNNSYSNYALKLNLYRVSPYYLFCEAASTLLNPSVRTLSITTMSSYTGAIASYLSVGQSLLLLLLIAVNGLNGLNVIRSMDGMLQVLQQFDGALPDVFGVGEETAHLHIRYTEESPFETRFFIVEISADGLSMTALLDNIAAVTEESADDLARQAADTGRNSGFVGRYRFRREVMADGGGRIFFLDGGVMLGSLQSLLKTTLLIYLLALLGVFAVAWLFSGHYAAPIVKTLETQRRFMADAEHELKTPLTIITTTTDVLQAELRDNQWLEAITEQTGRMNELITRLLTLSRLDNGDTAAPVGTANLSELSERAVKQVTPVTRAAGCAIRTEVAPGLCCEGCTPLMEQLLMILLDNAIQYSAGPGDIEVSLQLQREHLLQRVSNAWQPDPRLDMDRLFDRFYRGDPSRSRKTGGSGLGLSIARAIADKHHGQIAAAAEDNRFLITVRLPAARPC